MLRVEPESQPDVAARTDSGKLAFNRWLNARNYMPQTAGSTRRVQLKKQYWPEEQEWDGMGNGWFKSPRTLPLILALLSEKELTEGRDISRVYLELLARHMDAGVIEMGNEAEHAYAAGYTGGRGIRTWAERMHLLENLGFIKTKPIGSQRFKLVMVVDPVVAVSELRKQDKVPDEWWEAYRHRLLETKEADADRLEELAKIRPTKKAKAGVQ
jgi:hypothetical protein